MGYKNHQNQNVHSYRTRGAGSICPFNFAKQVAAIEVGLQEPVIKVGNLNSVRTWMDVRDAVKAYWLLVNKCKPGEVYNIGGAETMTIGEMLNLLLKYSTKKTSKSLLIRRD